jgi:hypothetical protein
MKLSKTHIAELYKFTRKHFVEHYDVQTELVDHLANDIEVIWEVQPHFSFQEACDRSFKKFGVFGFMDVIEAKQKQLGKRYTKVLLKFMKEWLSIPKLFVTLLIFTFFYILVGFKINENVIDVFLILLTITQIFLASKLIKKANKRFKEKKRKYLLEEMIFRTGSLNCILLFSSFLQFSNFSNGITSIWGKCFFSGLITVAIIFSYVSLIIVPQKAEALLQKNDPEYKRV